MEKPRALHAPSGNRRRRDSFDRAIASRMLCDYAGLTQRQATHMLGIATGAAVSLQLRNLSQALESDKRLQATVATIAAKLNADRPDNLNA